MRSLRAKPPSRDQDRIVQYSGGFKVEGERRVTVLGKISNSRCRWELNWNLYTVALALHLESRQCVMWRAQKRQVVCFFRRLSEEPLTGSHPHRSLSHVDRFIKALLCRILPSTGPVLVDPAARVQGPPTPYIMHVRSRAVFCRLSARRNGNGNNSRPTTCLDTSMDVRNQ